MLTFSSPLSFLFTSVYIFVTILCISQACCMYFYQMEADKSVNDPNSHIINIGQLVEVISSVSLLLYFT